MEPEVPMMHFEDGGRDNAKECRRPLEAGNGKEMDSPLELPEGTQPCRHLDFRTSYPPELR